MLDGLSGGLFGMLCEDLQWILRDCDHPEEKLRDRAFTRSLDPKGFWRVDRDRPPHHRRTVLAMEAFSALQRHLHASGGELESAVPAFCTENRGDGWIPAVGPDPRLLTWQDCTSPAESWSLCGWHALRVQGVALAHGTTRRPTV